MTAYYNEIDPYAAQWLRNLIEAGHIAPGFVDTRSIEEVTPDDLAGYTQCHFFAGLGGWALALDLAGWPRDRAVWTGSCPCQPFSAAGKGDGFDDERHLWPAWQHLIAERRPPVIFGEQVASKAAAPWIDLVHADMEGLGYTFGCIPFPAAGIGAPHIRDRNYWVAHTDGVTGDEGRSYLRGRSVGSHAQSRPGFSGDNVLGRMADTDRREQQGLAVVRGDECHGAHGGWSKGVSGAAACCDVCGMAHTEQHDSGCQAEAANYRKSKIDGSTDQHGGYCGASVRLGNADDSRLEIGRGGLDQQLGEERREAAERPAGLPGIQGGTGPTNGLWRDADWLQCRDGKWRCVEPGTFPLAHGVSGRVGRLRAYGNAIVPQQAAHFIEAFVEAQAEGEVRTTA